STAEVAPGLGSLCDPPGPADEPRLGGRQLRRALRRQPRPVHGDADASTRRARPAAGKSNFVKTTEPAQGHRCPTIAKGHDSDQTDEETREKEAGPATTTSS